MSISVKKCPWEEFVLRVMHVMGGGDVGGAKTHIMNMVTGLTRRNEVMLVSFRAGPFADEARERGIDVRVICLLYTSRCV